ncbi:MAG: major capsid protein, partial [Candidatus Methanomethylicaceae archaeon]
MSRNSAGSSNQSHFANIPSVNVKRSTFDRSFTHKTTFDSGKLIPFYVDEILPGDTMKVSSNILARLTTPLFPYMDNLYLDVHFFFVPKRLIWENWERFNGAQDNPEDSTDYLVPQLDASLVTGLAKWPVGGLPDYFGIPTGIDGSSWTQDEMPNALPFRAYNLIWNEWYRDQNLMNSVPVPKGDGPDDPADYVLLDRCRRKDYFTSALPWPQKGPSVLLPMTGNAPVLLTEDFPATPWTFKTAATGATGPGGAILSEIAPNLGRGAINAGAPGYAPFVLDPEGSLYADLSEV